MRGTTFRVATSATFTKARIGRGHYNLDRTIDATGDLDADVVGVQEVMRQHLDFHCDDQPALIAKGLRQRTGRPWTHVHAKAWITETRDCVARNRGSDVATEELAIFVAGPILFVELGATIGRARRTRSSQRRPCRTSPVIVTHLAANRDNQRDRIDELGVLLPWTAQQGPGILMGDFNAQPDSVELGPVRARYRDAGRTPAARPRGRCRFGGHTTGSPLCRASTTFSTNRALTWCWSRQRLPLMC